jgi:hypothetical protein
MHQSYSMPHKPSAVSNAFQSLGFASSVNPCEPDRSEFVEVAGLRMRVGALVRLRREYPKLNDEQIVAEVIAARSGPRAAIPKRKKKKSHG